MLGKKIKELRKESGITQKELAKQLGITFQAVSQWEKDQTDPDILNILALAKVFGVTTDELLEHESASYVFEYQHKDTKLIHKERK